MLDQRIAKSFAEKEMNKQVSGSGPGWLSVTLIINAASADGKL